MEAVLINLDGQMDGHRNMTNVIGTFRHYANAFNKVSRMTGSYILHNIKGSILRCKSKTRLAYTNYTLQVLGRRLTCSFLL